MPSAKARHILVATEKECKDLKKKLDNGGDFTKLAKKFSKCPSGEQGGFLGEFSPGEMVAEFDKVVFSAEPGAVSEPVKTDFGYHLIEVISRKE